MKRRLALATLGAGLAAPSPAWATNERMAVAIQAFTSGAAIQDGRVVLEVAELVENGNAVPVTIAVESHMTPVQHVRRIGLFSERNPSPDVAVFTLTPRAGRARVSTRIRLADSQLLVAVAEMSDGTFWRHQVRVVVTLAACVEGI